MSKLTVAARGFAAVCLMGMLAVVLAASAEGQDKKKEKDPLEGKKGKTIGLLVKNTGKAIEVKADGEEKARRYVPQWVGGAGGGFDKATVKTFIALKVGSRVEVEWLFEERFRALAVKVLAPPKDAK
jgi:hypothetical protein